MGKSHHWTLTNGLMGYLPKIFDRPALPVPRPGRDREARRDRASNMGDDFLRELNNKH
jgi:hypothetical protein